MNLAEELRNILENWENIKDYMPGNVVKVYNNGKEDWQMVLDEMPEEIDSLESVPTFVKMVNENIPKKAKYVPASYEVKMVHSHGKKTRTKKATSSTASSPSVTVAPSPETTKSVLTPTKSAAKTDVEVIEYKNGICVIGYTKDIMDVLKAAGGKWDKLRAPKKAKGEKYGWIFKPEQKAHVEAIIRRLIKKEDIDKIKIGGKSYKVVRPDKAAKFKLVSKRKTTRTKATRKTVTKAAEPEIETPRYLPAIYEAPKKRGRRSTKPKVGESPNWYKTMRTFVEAAGRSVPVRSVRKMLNDLVDRFDARRHLNTPHITVLREIQDKLIPYANKTTTKVKLPAWKTTVAECKKCMRTINVDGKTKLDAMTSHPLAGFDGDFYWAVKGKYPWSKPFATLAEAKKYVKERSEKDPRKTFELRDLANEGDFCLVRNFYNSRRSLGYWTGDYVTIKIVGSKITSFGRKKNWWEELGVENPQYENYIRAIQG